MAKLIRNVHVPGHGWYGPAYQQPPAEVAALITNPSAWQRTMIEEADAAVAAPEAPADSTPRTIQDELASIATDKPALLAFAEGQRIDVDGRLGARKLHAAMAEALKALGTPDV